MAGHNSASDDHVDVHMLSEVEYFIGALLFMSQQSPTSGKGL